MKSVQKTDDGRLSEGSNPSASATALILCGIRAGEGFFFCFSLRISDSNGVNGRVFPACFYKGRLFYLQKNVYKLLPFSVFRCEKLRIAV